MPGAFLVNNQISSNATIAPSSEDASYPAENLYDLLAAKVFRCTSKTSLTILIDFGASIAADTIALINHNLTQNATLNLKAGNVNPPVTTIATPAYRQYDLWKSFTQLYARYWLLTITDSNPDYLQIGQLILGSRTAFPRGRLMGNYKPAIKRSNIAEETYAGVLYAYHLFDRHEFNPSFRVSSAAELTVLQALDAAAYGNLKPFLYIPDVAGSDCYYVRKEQNFEPEEVKGRLAGNELVHDYQMQLTEESRGLEIEE